MGENAERNLKSGIDVYNDNLKLENELAKYTSVKQKNKFLDQYLKENDVTEKELLKSHIAYLKKEYATPIGRRKYMIFVLVSICCVIIAVAFNAKYIYKKFYDISISDKTYVEAKEYYNKGEYNEASVRLKKLISNGFDGYAVYYYPSMISRATGDYDSSAAAIEYFINQYYGVANITYNSRVYEDLRWIYNEGGLSAEASARVGEMLSKAIQYANVYESVDKYLDDENYLSAVHTCKLLINEGAHNYRLAVAYVYSLVMIKEYMSAYDYILRYLETLSSYQEHTVSKEQRIILLEFIMPFLEGENFEAGYSYLERLQGMEDITSGQDTQYELSAEGAVDYDSVEGYIPVMLRGINYGASLDRIFVERNTCIVRGRECYSIEVTHSDGDSLITNYFFYAREQGYVYVLLNGQYIDISSVAGEPGDGTALTVRVDGVKESKGKYVNDNGIEIIISEGGDTCLFDFCIRDTNTGEIILEKEDISWDICTTYEDEYLELSFIWGEKLVVMVRTDVLNKYRKIESVYTLET